MTVLLNTFQCRAGLKDFQPHSKKYIYCFKQTGRIKMVKTSLCCAYRIFGRIVLDIYWQPQIEGYFFDVGQEYVLVTSCSALSFSNPQAMVL